MINWQLYRNLENSLKDFLDIKVSEDEVTDICNKLIPVRVGRKNDNDWTIPCITIYLDDETANRLEIGSNLRDKEYLIILDIYATNEGERQDLACWLADVINNGFPYYNYSPNLENPDVPNKVSSGNVSLNFVTNRKINLGQDVNQVDAHRHRITITGWITG